MQVAVEQPQLDSLVGTFCPGTVSITCEGIFLTNLRWTYNGGIGIIIFETDSVEQVYNVEQPAFISVELRSVVQYTDVRYANFTSVLTADLAQLHELSVRDISCGNPIATITLPVGVSLQSNDEIPPPNITSITAVYNSTHLDLIRISWRKIAVRTFNKSH